MRVTFAVVLKGSIRSGIPAVLPSGLREDHDEAVLVGERHQTRHLAEGPRSVPLAVVGGHHDGRIGGRLVWDIDVHVDIAGQIANAAPPLALVDLLQHGRTRRRGSEQRNVDRCARDKTIAKSVHGSAPRESRQAPRRPAAAGVRFGRKRGARPASTASDAPASNGIPRRGNDRWNCCTASHSGSAELASNVACRFSKRGG